MQGLEEHSVDESASAPAGRASKASGSRALFRDIFEHAPAAIIVSRLSDGRILHANQAALTLAGLDRDELIGQMAGAGWVYPDQRPGLMRRLRAHGGPEHLVFEGRTQSGTPLVLEGTFTLFDAGDEPCVLAVVEDITEHVRAASASESAAVPYTLYNTSEVARGRVEVHEDGLRVYADNAAAAAVLGVEEGDASAPGWPPPIVEVWRAACHRSSDGGTPVMLEYLHQTQAHERWLSVTLRPTAPGAEDAASFAFVATDVTERKQAEQQLRTAYKQVEELSRFRSTVLSNLTHEVRTPLTVILGFTSILRSGTREPYTRFIDRIERSGQRLLMMLDSMLDLARLEAGSFTVDPQPFDVTEAVHSEVAAFYDIAEHKGIELDVESAPRLLVLVDRQVFGRAFTSVLDNAVKFTASGRVRISLEATDTEVHVHVEDTGVGIDTDYLPHIFDAFSQESTGLTRAHQGSGLGLTVAHRLLSLAGGSIDVESEKGVGSVFTLVLPRYASAA